MHRKLLIFHKQPFSDLCLGRGLPKCNPMFICDQRESLLFTISGDEGFLGMILNCIQKLGPGSRLQGFEECGTAS